MPKTWKEMKDAALQLMFSYSNQGTIDENSANNKDFILAMPNAANYALRDLCEVSRPIIRYLDINHYPLDNQIDEDTAGTFVHSRNNIIFTASEGACYTFETAGKAEVYIENAEGLAIKVICTSGPQEFQRYYGKIDGAGHKKMTFCGAYPYLIRNIAIYDAVFETPEEIPPYGEFCRYDMRELTSDFMKFAKEQGVVQTTDGNRLRGNDWQTEGENIISIRREKSGTFRVFYYAYPKEITQDTQDNYELELPSEILDLVPLYMAARLYGEDDIQLATSYLNQYQVKRAELSQNDYTTFGKSEFISGSGW